MFYLLFETKNTSNIATVRAGNVIGAGDWSNYRLVPDFLNPKKMIHQSSEILIQQGHGNMF